MAIRPRITPPNLPSAELQHNRMWMDQFSNILRLFFHQVANSVNFDLPQDTAVLTDGVSAPAVVTGGAVIYVDKADGDLKIKFSDGTVKTIVTDT